MKNYSAEHSCNNDDSLKIFDENIVISKHQVDQPQTSNDTQSEYNVGFYQTASNKTQVFDSITEPLHSTSNDTMIAALHTSDDPFVIHIKTEKDDY